MILQILSYTIKSGALTRGWALDFAAIAGDHHAVVSLQRPRACSRAKDAVGEVALPHGSVGIVEAISKLAHLQGQSWASAYHDNKERRLRRVLGIKSQPWC